jgi:hypothetical protein
MERAEDADSRVVNENFNLAELTAGLLNHSLDVCSAGYIRNDRQSSYAFIAKACGGSFDRIAAPGGNRHGRAQPAKPRGNGPANAAAGSSNQSGLLREHLDRRNGGMFLWKSGRHFHLDNPF